MNAIEKAMLPFIATYGAAAKAATAGTKIFPETVLTAAALESGYAKSNLSKIDFNFFGIKAQPGDKWKGATVKYQTREEDKNGGSYYVTATFRKYPSAEDSFKDYVRFIQGPRYIKAGVTKAANPQEQFERIHAAGYATDKSYTTKLKNIFNAVTDWVKAYPVSSGAGIVAAFLVVFFLALKPSTK